MAGYNERDKILIVLAYLSSQREQIDEAFQKLKLNIDADDAKIITRISAGKSLMEDRELIEEARDLADKLATDIVQEYWEKARIWHEKRGGEDVEFR